MKSINYVQKEAYLELNKDIVSMVRKYTYFQPVESGIIVHCEIVPVDKVGFKPGNLESLFTDYGTINTSAEGKSYNQNDFRIIFRVIADDMVRVTVNPGENPFRDLYVKPSNAEVSYKIVETENAISLVTSRIELVIDKEKAKYYIKNNGGQVIFEERNDEKSIYFGYFSPPLSKVKVDQEDYLCQSFKRSNDEDFYGFGEQFMDFNKKGLVMDMWNADPGYTMGFISYKNIPFFISTKGYGFILNSSKRAFFDMGSKTTMAYNVKIQGDELDYYIILNPDLKGILKKYYSLTGQPALPPKWSFGLWMSSPAVYKTENIVKDMAVELREKKLPTDVLHIDPFWMDMRNESLVCDLTWGSNFKNHSEMIKFLKERHFKLSLWIAPYVPTSGGMYEEGAENGYFVKDRAENLIINKGSYNFWSAEFVYIDFTNPAAEKWYKSKIKQLIEEGVDVIKTDLGELGSDEALYYNGMDGKEGHNFYTLEYQRIVYEATYEVKQDDSMIWCRSGFIGSQKYPVHWAGDVDCSFDFMAGQLRAILGAGLSGFVFFSHDIGGFIGTPTPALYIRWFQFGMFTSHSRCHGGAPHEPWHYGDKAMDICRKFALLRYSLIPHIYSSAVECCQKGEPMLKALVLEYQEDLNVRNLDTEYLFCDDFLVAPMFIEEGSRKIYLPEGDWVDYWTKEVAIGGRWIEYSCSLDIIPLFVRRGSIIVMTEPGLFIKDEPWEKLTLEIYPGVSCEKKVFYDKEQYGSIRYNIEDDVVNITVENIPSDIEVKIIELSPVKYSYKILFS